MTCRVARSFHNSVSRLYLCQICARSIVEFMGRGTHDENDENGRV